MNRYTKRERRIPEVTVIGAGKFGHAVAEIVAKSHIETALVTRSETRREQIRQRLSRATDHLSVYKFGEMPLGQYVFLALPSSDLPDMAAKLATYQEDTDRAYISLSKGLTAPDGETPYELLSRRFGEAQCAVVSGPSLADELPRFGAHLAVASTNTVLVDRLTPLLQNDTILCSPTNDPTGVEWAGIAKNIATLGFHASHGATNSLNIAGAYASALYGEVWDYAAEQGANPRSFIGAAGVGDLLTTSYADTSRNVRAGKLLGEGRSVGEAEARIRQAIELFHTVPLLDQRITRDGGIAPAISTLATRIVGEGDVDHWLNGWR